MALHIFWFWYYDRIAAYFHHYATYEIPYGLYIHINVHFPKHKHFICMAKFFIYNIFTIHKNDWPNSMMMNFCWWCCLCKKFNSVIFSCDFLIKPQPSTFLLVYYDTDAGNDSDNIILCILTLLMMILVLMMPMLMEMIILSISSNTSLSAPTPHSSSPALTRLDQAKPASFILSSAKDLLCLLVQV